MIARCACESQHVYSAAHQTGRTASIVMVLSVWDGGVLARLRAQLLFFEYGVTGESSQVLL